jgi:hypothetical protein|tara:strand:+ start:48 stop:470 length:423 start_codon:yes stop_codon:yes gene_type:complete
MKDIILYWPRFFREAWYTRKYFNAVKSIEPELIEGNLRVDWIGRIYTVINVTEELVQQPDLMQQSWVFQQLGPINSILLKHGLSNDAFPEITKIDQVSYLVVLYPENDHFNLYSYIRNMLFLAGLVGSIIGIVSLVKHFM